MAAVLEVNATRMAILGLNISGDYLDVDAWLANVTNATNAADGRDEGGRRRKLQQVVNLGFGNADTFLESDIKLLFKVDPPDEGDNIVVLVDDLLRLAVLGNVTQGTRKSVCGNRICESGETCHNDHYVQDLSAISGDRCCPLDCPLAVDTCPSSDNVGNPNIPCSGNGLCLTGCGGVCDCFIGYEGEDCGECNGANFDKETGRLLFFSIQKDKTCQFIPPS
eukprot:81573-Prorocentrum_minimum.AAC.1